MERLVCDVCAEAIGVYEPAVVVEDDGPRVTSLGREPDLGNLDRPVMHEACALRRGLIPAAA